MKKYTRFLFTASFLLMVFLSTAQNTNTSAPDSTTPATTVSKSAQPKEARGDTTKDRKDMQNQLKFMHPDMESRKYNFYERRSVSTPLMPRYDLDSAVYQSGKRRQKQQQAYKNNQYFFPAKPKDAWELGVNFGAAFVSGNVKPKINPFNPLDNIGAGLTIRKSFGYTFSLRAQYMFQQSTGRDWQPNANLKFNRVLNPFPNSNAPDSTGPNYYTNPRLDASRTEFGLNMKKLFFYNYRTHVHDLSLQAIANLGNINFHRERNIVNIYVLAGIDAYIFQTKYDALDADGNVYDFSKAYAIYTNQYNNNGSVNYLPSNKKRDIYKALSQILDGKYETYAEQDQNVPGFKHWQFVPSFSIGAGIAFHVTRFLTIGLEQRVIWSQKSGLLDGYRWQQDEHAALTSHNDNISYTSVNFNFHLLGKKRTEPLYWLNPMHYSYRKIGEVNPQAFAEELFKDDDNDGVPNVLDREPNTKKGCPVDSHGVILDSDHDGIPDCEDKEPFSAPTYPVDSNGVAIVPPNPCCDTTRFYKQAPLENYNNAPTPAEQSPTVTPANPENTNTVVPVVAPVVVPGSTDTVTKTTTTTTPPTKSAPVVPGKTPDKTQATPSKTQPPVVVPPVVTPIPVPTKKITDCSKIELPFVVFDGEKYYVDPQYFGNLHQIAERMQMCPEIKIVVTGYGEARNEQKFNEQLGWNRANAGVDYLVEKYGISRDRFILKYVGSKTVTPGTAYERKMKNKVEFRYANEGETGESNPPAPHPGIKAGQNK